MMVTLKSGWDGARTASGTVDGIQSLWKNSLLSFSQMGSSTSLKPQLCIDFKYALTGSNSGVWWVMGQGGS